MFLISLFRSPSQELQSIVQHVHSVLGVDDQSSRTQLTIWSQLGHPSPFREMDKASTVLHLLELLHCVDINSPERVPSAKDDHKVALLFSEEGWVCKALVDLLVRVLEGEENAENNGRSDQLSLVKWSYSCL